MHFPIDSSTLYPAFQTVGLHCQTPTLTHCVPCREAVCTIFMTVFGMTWPRGELTTYRVRGGHATDWANPTRSNRFDNAWWEFSRNTWLGCQLILNVGIRQPTPEVNHALAHLTKWLTDQSLFDQRIIYNYYLFYKGLVLHMQEKAFYEITERHLCYYRIRPNYRPCPHNRPPPPDFLLYFHLSSPIWRSFSWLFTLFSLIIAHLTIFWH